MKYEMRLSSRKENINKRHYYSASSRLFTYSTSGKQHRPYAVHSILLIRLIKHNDYYRNTIRGILVVLSQNFSNPLYHKKIFMQYTYRHPSLQYSSGNHFEKPLYSAHSSSVNPQFCQPNFLRLAIRFYTGTFLRPSNFNLNRPSIS